MGKIAFVTDSTAYLTEELKNHPDVYSLPLSIIIDDVSYADGVDLTVDELYERIRKEKEVPKTSQPAIGMFAELYEKLKEDYDAAVSIHISDKLSGTMASAKQGSDLVENFHVEVVDSKCMSYAITHLINESIRLSEEGKEAAEIAEHVRDQAGRTANYILLGSLDQFYKGGRMSGAQYLIGSVLKIKPVITITPEGEFNLFERVRSEKKAMNRLVELLYTYHQEHPVNKAQIMHGNVSEKASQLEAKLKEKMPNLDIMTGEISSTIAVHAGEGTLALLWQKG
ncbi:DegV family protein [Alteribacter keqinensis]|uniref:DegV family protein n=1 Tax=Alteribacter keqinensis TaxID=2483800 RepID=A0A3M7TWI6_9BACI|nr:DegV family protein [Alteribacter keqinensis]RNA69843.1 DegV family protein [Alteribacter keqinensis]